MAASAWRVYNEAKKYLLTGDLDLNAGLMRMKILKATKAAAVSDYTRSTFASLTHETTNLTTPLRTLTNVAVTAGASAKEIKFDFDDEVWTASGGAITSVQYAVIGVSGGKALAWCKLSTAAIDIGSGSTLTITINASGAFTLTGGTT
jgi:predicted Zn-dependent protease